MNYQKIYDSLIERARKRTLEGCTEKHHIIPRCMGGNDEKENLVDLTPEEHYLAHQLLVKIYPKNKALVRAASMMIPNRPSNKMYVWLKRRFSIVQSESQSGNKNSQYGKFWITDGVETKKVRDKSDIPEGWVIGRTIKKIRQISPPIFKQISRCNKCINEERRIEAEFWYIKFLESDAKSIRDFVRTSGYKNSHVSFIKMLKKHIPNFNPIQGKPFNKN
jgi:hypothetical protein